MCKSTNVSTTRKCIMYCIRLREGSNNRPGQVTLRFL
jgi:hypothetical protein